MPQDARSLAFELIVVLCGIVVLVVCVVLVYFIKAKDLFGVGEKFGAELGVLDKIQKEVCLCLSRMSKAYF